VLAVAVGLAAVAGLVLPMVWGDGAGGGGGHQTLAASTGKTSPLRVEAVRPVRGGVRRLTIQPGSVHAFESVQLYAKASGFLKQQTVDIGSVVKRGELLAEIDAPELLRDVDEAEATVGRAKAQADQAASRVVTAEAEQAAAAAQVARAESDISRLAAQRVLAEKQYDRIAKLNDQNAVARELVDEHRHALDSARAAEQTGQASVREARAQQAAAAAKVTQAKADVAEAKAAVRVAEAHRDRAKVLAAYTRITAPFDGVVTNRTFHPGAFIRSADSGGIEPLLEVKRTDKVRVVIRVPDLDVPLLDVGDRVTVAIDALKGKEFVGPVARLGKMEDPTTRTMRAEVDLPNPDGLLVDGMYGRATIELQPPTDNLTAPAAAVVGHSGNGRAAVYIVRDGKARKVPVTVGSDDGSSVEILSGIKPDDPLILRPGGSIDDGAPVAATLVPPADAARR
jgi:RND family efflux transporter MFP subunit